jgi:hypothetical protein
MSVISNFDIATDLKVEFFVPNAAGDTFILGVSELGGTDLLSGSGEFILGYSLLGGTDILATGDGTYSFIWEPAQAEVSAFSTSLGGSINDNFTFNPESASANISMQSYTYDPTNNSAIRSGTPIRIRLDDGVIDQVIYSGYIDAIDVSYYPDGPNVIRISAYDIYKRLVNSRIPLWDTTDYGADITPLEQIEEVALAAGMTVSGDSDDPAGLIPTEVKTNATANIFINDALQVGLAVIWINPETSEIELRNRPKAATGGATTYTIGNNHPTPSSPDPYHLCMSDIKVLSDQGMNTNSLLVTLASNDTISVLVENQDSIDLYGTNSDDVTVNTTNIGELQAWAEAVFAGMPAHAVKTVETPAIDRLGNLTQAAIFTPGTLIGVNYTTSNINIDEYYTITKVSHSVDVNNWFTTLELWKEF